MSPTTANACALIKQGHSLKCARNPTINCKCPLDENLNSRSARHVKWVTDKNTLLGEAISAAAKAIDDIRDELEDGKVRRLHERLGIISKDLLTFYGLGG